MELPATTIEEKIEAQSMIGAAEIEMYRSFGRLARIERRYYSLPENDRNFTYRGLIKAGVSARAAERAHTRGHMKFSGVKKFG